MKSYLDLVPISSKIHKRQNRMSIFCIVLSVFLVTVIFGMADMFIRSQLMQARSDYGNWHIALKEMTQEEAALISARPQVDAASWYGVLNYRGEDGYTLDGRDLIICGSDQSWLMEMLTDFVTEGTFPQTDHEAMVVESVKSRLGLQIGDPIRAEAPGGGTMTFTITGFVKNASKTMSEDSYGLFLNTSGFRALNPAGDDGPVHDSVFYIQFSPRCNIRREIADIKTQYGLGDQQVSENTQLLGLLGQSGSPFMLQIYGTAFVLFVLVLIAGILMIAGSLNSNIAQRTEFFGMIRCIGATPKQIMRLVRKEALLWCRFAIPAGVLAGMVLIWILCALLRFLSPAYFGAMPALEISLPSILTGVVTGLMTVLLAARSPARRASKVSPLTAVSGNAGELRPVRRAAHTTLFNVDTALGIHHAVASKRNFFLMAGSFSLSIILFLAFSVTVDFMHHSMTPLKPWSPDLSVISPGNSCSIDAGLPGKYENNPAVKRAYGRMFTYGLPVMINGREGRTDVISYEDNQFGWAEEYLLEGSAKAAQEEEYTGLAVFDSQFSPQVGDTAVLNVDGRQCEIRIVGILSTSPFHSDPGVGTIICSENTFRQITGKSGYTIVDVQLKKHASDADVELLRAMAGTEFRFTDDRLGNSSAVGTFYSFGLFIYGFLAVIALITSFNIINSIAMSVAARRKQYGVFRAIGLSAGQLKKMIAAEAVTYGAAGGIFGCAAGLAINRYLYQKLVSFRWGEPWQFPLWELILILAVVAASLFFAVRGPIRRIRKQSIVESIGDQ